jgi:Arc/MetJ family transcription regulator
MEGAGMRTNIEIDDKLMAEAMRSSGAKTKKAAVEEALQLMVNIKAQEGVLKLFGIGGLDLEYNYRARRVSEKWNGRSSSRDEVAVSTVERAGDRKRGAGKRAA